MGTAYIAGMKNPNLGENPLILEKRHPACAGRRAGDAIPGGVIREVLQPHDNTGKHNCEDTVRQNQLPDPVVKPGGIALNKPVEWR
jgi:hypothetical protein